MFLSPKAGLFPLNMTLCQLSKQTKKNIDNCKLDKNVGFIIYSGLISQSGLKTQGPIFFSNDQEAREDTMESDRENHILKTLVL